MTMNAMIDFVVRLRQCAIVIFGVLMLTSPLTASADQHETDGQKLPEDIDQVMDEAMDEAESMDEMAMDEAEAMDETTDTYEASEVTEQVEDQATDFIVELAQEDSSASRSILQEEVIVTSTKRATSLQTTPIAVSAFTQDTLDREKVLDITNIADLVPNLQISESPSDSGVNIAVRGISSNNFTEIGDPTVGIHVDGAFTPRPQAALALMHDVSRVEINRGPQGTLFGRNSTAGSINIITRRPTFEEFSGNLELDVASFNRYTFRGWFNFPVWSDGFGLRFSFLYDVAGSHLNQRQDLYDFGWDDNGDGDFDDTYDIVPDGIPNTDQRFNRQVGDRDSYGAIDRYATRLNMLLATSDRYSLLLTADYFRDSSPGGVSLKDCEKAEGTFFACEHGQWDISINTPGALDFRLMTFRKEFRFDLTNNLRLEWRSAYSRQFRDQYYDSDGGAFVDPDHPSYGVDRDGGLVGSEYTARYGRGAVAQHQLVGGPQGDNQYILDVLGFGGSTISPYDDQALITRWSNYDSRVTELQFSSIASPDNAVEWIAGFFYMKEENAIRFDVEATISPTKRPMALSFVQPNRDVGSIAAFGQIDVPFTDRFKMTFGVRWTRDEKSDTGGLNYRSVGYWEGPYAYTDRLQGLPDGGALLQYGDDGRPVLHSNGDGSYVNRETGEPVSIIPYHAYDLVGLVPGDEINLYQSDDQNLEQGTYSPDILQWILDSNDGFIRPNTFEDSWTQTTWKVGFDFTINDRLFWYGYIATGFKAGGFTDKVDLCGPPCNLDPIVDAFPYEPEKNLTYETGIKAELFDSERAGTMNFIATIFLSEIDDYQVTTFATLTNAGTNFLKRDIVAAGEEPDGETIDVLVQGEVKQQRLDPETGLPSTVTVTVENTIGNLLTYNVGKSRNIGLEIEFDWWNPWPNGRLHGWLTFLNAEVRDLPASDGYFCLERQYLGLTPCPPSDPNVPNDPGTSEDESRRINLSGNKLPWSPELALNLFIEHNFYFGDSGYRLSPYLSFHWTDEYFFDLNNFDEGPLHNGQPSYWSVNLSIRFIDEKRNWRLEIYGYNLTDERIRVWQDNGPGYVRSNFATPRNFGLKLAWDF